MTRPFFLALLIVAVGFGTIDAQTALVRPKPPAIKNRPWIQIPLDAFFLAKLEAAGIPPSPEAPREEVLRRLTLAIAGRPATADEIAAFVNTSVKRAYEKEVDRLLASPDIQQRFASVTRHIDKSDPRSASAAANECWRVMCGSPLVTKDDLGHADALEWLACELIDPSLVNCCELDRPLPEAWDVKNLVRAIAVSAVYRQASGANAEAMRRDPENRLWGRWK